MFLIFVAILGGSWGFGGFASDPAHPAAVKPGLIAPIPSGAPLPIPAVVVPRAPSVEEESLSAPKSLPSKQIEAKPFTRPTLWRLAEIDGQVWEHADPTWLRYWVAWRNAKRGSTRLMPQDVPGTTLRDGTCPSGRCERTH